MTPVRPPWTVQVAMVVVIAAGVVVIVLGARTRGADIALAGLAQMVVGIGLCVLAVSAGRGSAMARLGLVAVLTALAVVVTRVDVSAGRRWTVLAVAALGVALLTLPRRSRAWFEGETDPHPDTDAGTGAVDHAEAGAAGRAPGSDLDG